MPAATTGPEVSHGLLRLRSWFQRFFIVRCVHVHASAASMYFCPAWPYSDGDSPVSPTRVEASLVTQAYTLPRARAALPAVWGLISLDQTLTFVRPLAR
jgi:hypothetical protein